MLLALPTQQPQEIPLPPAATVLTPLRPKIVVLIPARNEEASIAKCVQSLRQQTIPPDEIIVIANNYSDNTAHVAWLAGADVLDLRQVPGKKAGALNVALETVLPRLRVHDAVLVMDADSVLDPWWIEEAVRYISSGYDACGGVFTGQPGGGVVGLFQRNEYARYARDVSRLNGRTLVLTGTATLFRVLALREVLAARRDGRLPAGVGGVYDTRVLTEDNELTLALLTLKRRIIAPADCSLTTEIMSTWRELHAQRLRWKRGALENLMDYGLNRVTLKYWGRQALSLLGLFVMVIYVASFVVSLALTGAVHLHWYWMALTLIFVVEQTVTVRSRGRWMQLLASVLVVEMAYDLFLQATQIRAFAQTVLRSHRSW